MFRDTKLKMTLGFKNIKSTKNSAVHDHMVVSNNIVSFEDFSVLANRTDDFRIKLQESLFRL